METDAAASVHSAAHAPLVTAVTVVPTHISTLQSGNLEAPLLSIDVPGRLEQPLGVSELMLPEAASDEKKKVRSAFRKLFVLTCTLNCALSILSH